VKQPTGNIPPKKIALDEQTFQQLLESAHVIQEHNDKTSGPGLQTSAPDSLAEIVETQRLIETRKLDLREVAQLIADRSLGIVHASGTAIGIAHDGQLTYLAASGSARLEAGTSSPVTATLSAAALSGDGTIIECPDTRTKQDVDPALCRSRQALSLIVVPMHYEGGIAASLELRFERANAFGATEVRNAELMASLLLEAIARDAELKWKQTVSTERTSLLEALDVLQPQLERLVEPSNSQVPAEEIPPQAEFSGEFFSQDRSEPVFSHERFHEENASVEDPILSEEHVPQERRVEPAYEPWHAPPRADDVLTPDIAEQRAPATTETPWNSATTTRQWLETLRPQALKNSWLSARWTAHRANIYLAISALLLLVVLSGWGTHSSQSGVSASATGNKAQPTTAHLTLVEKALVAFGLADPPPVPVNLGNPNAQVWIDLHTALYYCQGDPLYGKTPGGKLSLQRDAQLDQFEPAHRKVCD